MRPSPHPPAAPREAPWRESAPGRLDADHPDLPGVPGGDAADQPAAADGDEQRVEIFAGTPRRIEAYATAAP